MTRGLAVNLGPLLVGQGGPSAGAMMAAALVAFLWDTPLRRDTLATGELTLCGDVLPVGGIKEKVQAACRDESLRTVIVPLKNVRQPEADAAGGPIIRTG